MGFKRQTSMDVGARLRRVATETSKLCNLLIIKLAEREGFEPPVPCGTPDFESGAIDHSATSPGRCFLGEGIAAQTLPLTSRIFAPASLRIHALREWDEAWRAPRGGVLVPPTSNPISSFQPCQNKQKGIPGAIGGEGGRSGEAKVELFAIPRSLSEGRSCQRSCGGRLAALEQEPRSECPPWAFNCRAVQILSWHGIGEG